MPVLEGRHALRDRVQSVCLAVNYRKELVRNFSELLFLE